MLPKALCSALIVIVVLAVGNGHAQDKPDPQDSLIESLWKAEAEIQLLQSGGTLNQLNVAMRAWRRLKAIHPLAKDRDLRLRVERAMLQLEETLGEHDLQIANFYLSREHGGIRGAQSRLLHIGREYPDFSKMDEVLLRLSDVSLRQDDRDQARTYLYRLVCAHPGSIHAKAAFERLKEIGFDAREGCDKHKNKG